MKIALIRPIAENKKLSLTLIFLRFESSFTLWYFLQNRLQHWSKAH